MGTDQRKRPNCKRNTYYYFTNFCDSTSIHGFKFVGEHGRYWIEKIWWIVIVTAAISGATWLICKSYMKWNSSPVLVSFAAVETPISKIPFPAVTICPDVKVSSRVFNYTDNYLALKKGGTLEGSDKSIYNVVSLMCQRGKEYGAKHIQTDEFDRTLRKLHRPMMENCKWGGEDVPCNEVLSYKLTSDGWCITFNSLADEDLFRSDGERNASDEFAIRNWSLDGGYVETELKEITNVEDIGTLIQEREYPRRAKSAGLESGFKIDLYVSDEDLDYACSDLQGFKVTLHHPVELPNMDTHFRVPLDHTVISAIRPKMMTTADDIKVYPIDKRKCYVSGEKELMHFENYTQENCMVECAKNITEIIFNCTEFYVPSSEESNLPICGTIIRESDGYKIFLNNLMKKVMLTDLEDEDKECYCLPSCTALEYDSETSQSVWNWRKTYEFDEPHTVYMIQENDSSPVVSVDTTKYHMSRLIVYYKEHQFITSERHELYGVVDFLANCGGLVGLFCGFSFTSMMEILYYLTLRLFCNFRKYGGKVWSGAPELMHT